jgi:hypothetical protein
MISRAAKIKAVNQNEAADESSKKLEESMRRIWILKINI